MAPAAAEAAGDPAGVASLYPGSSANIASIVSDALSKDEVGGVVCAERECVG